MDEQARKAVLRSFSYGLFALAAGTASEPSAMTVNWITQSSFEPPLVAVALELDSRTTRVARAQGAFTVSVFEAGQRELAGQLGRRSSRHPDKLRGVRFLETPSGTVALADGLGYLECRVRSETESGDHVVVVAEVVDAVQLREGVPLTMAAAGFRYAG